MEGKRKKRLEIRATVTKTYPPKETPASDISNIRMILQTLSQQLLEILALARHIRHQILLLHNTLDLGGGGAGNRVRLIRVAMDKGASALVKGVNDAMADEEAGDGLESSAQPFADGLKVRDDVFLLPRVQGACTPHAAHHFVQDEQRAVLVADGLHGGEVAGD